jgi:hypothetical protein
VPELHRRASGWYAANGEPHEAITHALAGNDPARAAELIERAAPAMQRARQESQLRSWLEAVPAALYLDRPVLAMALVGARMATGDADGLDPLLEIVDTWLDRDDTAPVSPCSRATPTSPSTMRTGSSSWPETTIRCSGAQPPPSSGWRTGAGAISRPHASATPSRSRPSSAAATCLT